MSRLSRMVLVLSAINSCTTIRGLLLYFFYFLFIKMDKLNIEEQPHRRLNLLTGEWVLVSPHRAKRPWNGKVEKTDLAALPAHDPNCYLCAGNHRAGGVINPDYKGAYVFDNDFAALLPNTSTETVTIENLLQAKGESGICKVIIFSPRHDLTLPQLPGRYRKSSRYLGRRIQTIV